jgi:3-dehydroquinate dehydratase
MNKIISAVLMVSLSFIILGCATSKGSEEEIMGLESNYQFLSDRIDGLEARLKEIEDQVGDVSKKLVVSTHESHKLEELEKRIKTLEIMSSGQPRAFVKEPTVTEKAVGREPEERPEELETFEETADAYEVAEEDMEEDVQPLEPVEIAEEEMETPEPETMDESSSTFEIKVLSKVKNAASAKEAAEKLELMGYKVSRIDHSQKPFKKTTIFHAPGYLTHAIRIAGPLNGTIKPLTWKSQFRIIVVVVE